MVENVGFRFRDWYFAGCRERKNPIKPRIRRHGPPCPQRRGERRLCVWVHEFEQGGQRPVRGRRDIRRAAADCIRIRSEEDEALPGRRPHRVCRKRRLREDARRGVPKGDELLERIRRRQRRGGRPGVAPYFQDCTENPAGRGLSCGGLVFQIKRSLGALERAVRGACAKKRRGFRWVVMPTC